MPVKVANMSIVHASLSSPPFCSRKNICECLVVQSNPLERSLELEEGLCPVCLMPQKRPEVHLVLDLKFDLAIPYNFRSARDGVGSHHDTTVNELGLRELRVSGSGQVGGRPRFSLGVRLFSDLAEDFELRQKKHTLISFGKCPFVKHFS